MSWYVFGCYSLALIPCGIWFYLENHKQTDADLAGPFVIFALSPILFPGIVVVAAVTLPVIIVNCLVGLSLSLLRVLCASVVRPSPPRKLKTDEKLPQSQAGRRRVW